MKKKAWYDYLWIVTPIYFALGFFNILFAWLGMIFFSVPLLLAIFGGNKVYCNRYCDRGQLLTLLGKQLKCSANRPTPKWIGSKWFRYGFLIFFFAMFFQMLWMTYLVGAGSKSLQETVQLFWSFRVPWQWANPQLDVASWVIQFSYGFYSMMLTSTLIGLIVMVLFQPRSWCVFCPMGTMTQLICKWKAGNTTPDCAGCNKGTCEHGTVTGTGKRSG